MDSYEAAKVKLFEWPGLKAAVLNLDDPAGLRLVAHLQRAHRRRAAADRLHLARRGGPAGHRRRRHAARLAVPQPQCRHRFPPRVAVRRRHRQDPAGRPLQYQQRAGGARRADGQGRRAARRGRRDRSADAGAGPHAAGRRPGSADGGDRLRAHAGRAGKDPAGAAPGGAASAAASCGACSAAAATAIRASVRRWARSRRSPNTCWSPATIRAAKSRRRSSPRSSPAWTPRTPTSTFQAIEDRAAAILSAVKHAAKPDVILLAGKGHEPYQEIKGRKMPFSDADHAALALAARVTMMRTN